MDYYTNPCRLCIHALDGSPESLEKCQKYPRGHEDNRPDCPYQDSIFSLKATRE